MTPADQDFQDMEDRPGGGGGALAVYVLTTLIAGGAGVILALALEAVVG